MDKIQDKLTLFGEYSIVYNITFKLIQQAF